MAGDKTRPDERRHPPLPPRPRTGSRSCSRIPAARSTSARTPGNWTIPKGEVEPGEALLDVARREFLEETGQPVPDGDPIDLGEIRQKSGKRVVGWAVEGDLDPAAAHSNTFEMEWPPRSGLRASFPEIDRVAWFDPDEARRRIKLAQAPFLDRLETALGHGRARAPWIRWAPESLTRRDPRTPLAGGGLSRRRRRSPAVGAGQADRTGPGPTTGARRAGSRGRSR